MEDEYERRDYERSSLSDEQSSGDDKTFWYSLLSAVSVLAIVGLFLYAAQLNNPTPSGIQPGVGGGPGTLTSPTPSLIPVFSPSPFPSLSPAPMP